MTGPGPVQESDLVMADAFASGVRLLVFRVAQYTSVFLISLVVARALGPDGRAQFALALNLATVVCIVAQLSVDQAVVRMLARREASLVELTHLVSAVIVVVGLIGAVITLAIGIPARDALLGGVSIGGVVLAAASIPFTITVQLTSQLLLRIGGIRAYGWIVAATGALQLSLVAVAEVTLGLSPELTLLIAVVAIAVTAMSLAIALARRTGLGALTPVTDLRLVKSAFAIGVRLHVGQLAWYLTLYIDLLLVGLLVTTEQAGLYSLSVTLADVVFVAIGSLALGALEVQTRAEAMAATGYTMDFVRQNLAVTLVLALAVAAIAYPFITLLYGAEWKGSVLPFAVLMAALVARGVEGPVRGMLVRIAPPLTISAAAGAALVLNIGLNLWLIPKIGILGAAVASVASYWLGAALMLTLLTRLTGISVGRAIAFPRNDDLIVRLAHRLKGYLSPAGSGNA